MIFSERSADGVGIDATYQHISEAPAYQDPDGETVAVADDEPVGDTTTENVPVPADDREASPTRQTTLTEHIETAVSIQNLAGKPVQDRGREFCTAVYSDGG